MALLAQTKVQEIIQALLDSGLDTKANRGALLTFINSKFVGALRVFELPVAQLMSDIGSMNDVERLVNGDVPLQIYLQNAALLLMAAPEQDQQVIRNALDLVIHQATGTPHIDTTNLPEKQEAFIFTDDTVSFAFMQAGVEAATSVLKLNVPRFDNGQARIANGAQVIWLGTGWLLTDALVMTNHHVINARQFGEPNASDADLRLQAEGTVGQLDLNADNLAGTDLKVQKLEAWNAKLDYAVVRVPATGRNPLRRQAHLVNKGNDPIAVNIIQHPGGRGKRYGIRNNLVSAATQTELRYFTDTDNGSSGAPVFNDQWEVVALHHASQHVSDVMFQGKTTAVVNVGVQLPAIMDDLRGRFPVLAAEIGA